MSILQSIDMEDENLGLAAKLWLAAKVILTLPLALLVIFYVAGGFLGSIAIDELRYRFRSWKARQRERSL